MLRRVHPAVLFAAVAVIGFLAGDRVETWLGSPARELRANAAPLPRKIAPAKPLALRLPPATPSTPVAAVAPASTPDPTPAAALPEASAPLAEPAKPDAPQAQTGDDPDIRPSVVSGKDADSNVDYYEEKDLPESQGQGQENAHDVDMVEESNPAPQDAPADSTSDKKPSDN